MNVYSLCWGPLGPAIGQRAWSLYPVSDASEAALSRRNKSPLTVGMLDVGLHGVDDDMRSKEGKGLIGPFCSCGLVLISLFQLVCLDSSTSRLVLSVGSQRWRLS